MPRGVPILYYAPIIHSIKDYGSLGPGIKKAFVAKIGDAAFEYAQGRIEEFWELVEKRIEEAIPDVRGLIIYHDGFPVGDREKVSALFVYMIKDHPESPNFRLIKKLLERGAVLEGTEDMNLLREQLGLYQRIAATPNIVEQERLLVAQAQRSRELTKLRDEFIARRIRDTLPPDERGILFIGRDHDVISELEKLPERFTVIYL